MDQRQDLAQSIEMNTSPASTDPMHPKDSELRFCKISRLLIDTPAIPKWVELSLKIALKLEGGHFYSGSAREILKRRFGVSVGAYSYGECFTPGQFQRNTTVGRYVSIAPGVRTYVRDHPMNTLSTHPFFFNSKLRFVDADTVPFSHLVIDHDAWLGCNVVVTARCKRIGIGAVVAAGTLVTKNVDDFAVVGGIPGQFLFYRFPKDIRQAVLKSKWWELSPVQLTSLIPQLTRALPTTVEMCHPLLESIASLSRTKGI